MNTKNSGMSFASSKLFSYLFFVGILSNMVLPTFFVGINIHPALIFSALILFFLLFELSSKSKFCLTAWVFFPIILMLLVAVSDLYGKVVLGVAGNNSPLYNIILLIFTFLPYVIAISKIQEDISFKIFYRITNIFFILFLVTSLLQAFGPRPVSVFLINIYSHGVHTSTALAGLRYTLTGPDPNTGSAIAAFFIIFYFVFSVQLRALKYFLPLFASFIPLFLAQGRTVMIGLAVCFFLYFWFISGLKFHHKIAMFFVILSLLLMGVNLVEVDYLVRGILELSIGENGSVNVRLQKAFFVFDNFMKSPIIGQGANLEQYGRVKNIDSEYLLLLQRHGLIGLIFVVGTILLLMLKATKRLRFSLSAHMLLLLGGVALFVMLTNVFVFNIDTYGLFVIMIYLCVISKVRYPKKRFTSQSDFIFK